MASQLSMIGSEYKVRTITGDEFDVIYTRSSATVKGCLSRFRRMFKNSDDEWVAGLDVEYTTVLGREKDLEEEARRHPGLRAYYAWSTTYAMPMLNVWILRTFLTAT